MMGYGGYGGFGLGFGILGPIIMVLFWVGIIALIVWGVGAIIPHRNETRVTDPSALEILQRRYARGEISKEEFETIRKDIS